MLNVFSQTTLHASQTAQPPKPAPTSVHQTPQYPRYSGITAAGSQVNTGHAGASGATANHDVHHQVRNSRYLFYQFSEINSQVWESQRYLPSVGQGMCLCVVTRQTTYLAVKDLW
jgi:hypothetical protein